LKGISGCSIPAGITPGEEGAENRKSFESSHRVALAVCCLAGGQFMYRVLQAKLPGPLTRPSVVLISFAVTGLALSYATFVWIRLLRDPVDSADSADAVEQGENAGK
jgi:hypothetical protein